MTEAVGSRRPINAILLELAQLAAVTTPGWVSMRQDPCLHGWTSDIIAFSTLPELREFAPTLTRLGELFRAAPPSIGDAFNAMAAQAGEVRLGLLIEASRIAEAKAKDKPYASFMLAWVALSTWVLAAEAREIDLLGEELQGARRGWPNSGWPTIPAACIVTAIPLQGFGVASKLAERAIGMLQTNRRRHMFAREALVPAILRYRQLARLAADRQDAAIGDLCDALQDAMDGSGGTRARAVVAAILWTLGQVADCDALRLDKQIPSRAVLQQMIVSSLDFASTDPLLQYCWLELKSVPELAFREHGAVYTWMNHRWAQWALDEMFMSFGLSAEPSKIYARTLEQLMAGDLDEQGAAAYRFAFERMILAQGPFEAPHLVPSRLEMLAYVIGQRLDMLAESYKGQAALRWLDEIVAVAVRVGEFARLNPISAEPSARMNHALLEFIERSLESGSGVVSNSECARVALEQLERFRTGGLQFHLNVVAPTVTSVPGATAEGLALEEQALIERLRGSYFMAIRSALPMHVSWSDMDMNDLAALADPARRAAFYSSNVARKEMAALAEELKALAGTHALDEQEYAAQRLHPSVTWERLTSMLGRHRGDRADGEV